MNGREFNLFEFFEQRAERQKRVQSVSVCLTDLAKLGFDSPMVWNGFRLRELLSHAEEVEGMVKKVMAGEDVRAKAIKRGPFPLDKVEETTRKILDLSGVDATKVTAGKFNAVANCVVAHATELFNFKSGWMTLEEYKADSEEVLAKVKKLKEMYPRG